MYIVTGGAGFIGSAMVWKLNQMGIDDILIVDNLASSEKWKNLVNRRFTEYLHRDVFQKMVEEGKIDQKIDGIIHMGACSSTTERDVDFLMRNNVNYSKMVCRFAMEKGIRLINASSAATYGSGECGFADTIETALKLKPLNAYGWSKQLFDLWAIRKKGLAPLRASNSSTSMAPMNTIRVICEVSSARSLPISKKAYRSASSNPTILTMAMGNRCVTLSMSKTVSMSCGG